MRKAGACLRRTPRLERLAPKGTVGAPERPYHHTPARKCVGIFGSEGGGSRVTATLAEFLSTIIIIEYHYYDGGEKTSSTSKIVAASEATPAGLAFAR